MTSFAVPQFGRQTGSPGGGPGRDIFHRICQPRMQELGTRRCDIFDGSLVPSSACWPGGCRAPVCDIFSNSPEGKTVTFFCPGWHLRGPRALDFLRQSRDMRLDFGARDSIDSQWIFRDIFFEVRAGRAGSKPGPRCPSVTSFEDARSVLGSLVSLVHSRGAAQGRFLVLTATRPL